MGFGGETTGPGDVLLAAGESFLNRGELIHEGEAEVVLFGGEINGSESATEMLGGVPADLAAKAGLVTGVSGLAPL